MGWEKAISLDELKTKRKVLFIHGSKQILVWQTLQGDVFALDNRCPHEGYPLKEGSLDESQSVLTCNWHNWKFDIKSGNCLLGADHVRTYPIRQEAGHVWVDLSPDEPQVVLQKSKKSFLTAFQKRQYGRIARELARLHFQGIEPTVLFPYIFEWTHHRFENGITHAYAVTADWLQLAKEHSDCFENQLICFTEAFDHLSFDTLREVEYPYHAEEKTYSADAFEEAVEAEKEEEAISLLRGALNSGLHFADLEKTLVGIALRHYNDFGHSLIWLYKIKYLIQYFGNILEPWLLFPLIRSLCQTTREDLIPEFKQYGPQLERYPATLIAGTVNETPLEAESLFQKSVNASMDWVIQHARTHSPENMYSTLLEVNARNLLYYDLQYDQDPLKSVAQSIGWLDFSHAITFANAVRIFCTQYPEYWKSGLLQLACFNGRNVAFLNTKQDVSSWWVADSTSFFQACQEQILDHGLPLPIYSAHWLKTFMAVREEFAVVSPSCQKYLLASLNRFLHSPIKMKQVRRVVRQGLQLVQKDFVPKN